MNICFCGYETEADTVSTARFHSFPEYPSIISEPDILGLATDGPDIVTRPH